MINSNNRVRTAATLGTARKKPRQDQFQSPIGALNPSQKKMWDGMSESERELTKYFFHVPDVDMKKIDLQGQYGQPPAAERRKEDGGPRFLNLEEEEGETGTASGNGGAAGNTRGGAAVSAGDNGTFPEEKYLEGLGGMPDPDMENAAGGPAGPGAAVPGGGTDAAYRELLLRRAEKDPGLYSNPAFVRELRNAEQRMKTAGAFGLPEADSYSPERNWREAVGGVLGAVQNGLNALGMIGREMQAGRYASVAADQRFLGKLSGNGDYFDRADSLTALATETADRALEPAVDFGSRYRAETEELYPYAGPAQRFLDQVIQGTASLAPAIVGNLLLPGSGPYFQMLQSVGGAMAEAKKRGADDSTALAYGAAVGIADTMLEKLVDGMGGVFGKGVLEQMIGDDIRRAAGSSGAREALIYLGGMAGEGFEEFLSVFANELLDVHMLGATARTWEALLEDAGLSFFASALVSGLVQGASRLGALVDSGADDLTVADLGRQLAEDVEAELRQAQGDVEPVYAEEPEFRAAPMEETPLDFAVSEPSTESELAAEPELDSMDFAIDETVNSEYTKTLKRQKQVLVNNKTGMDYEAKEFPLFRQIAFNAQRHITLVSESGKQMVADAIGTVDGAIVIMEYKSSLTARLSKNQKQVFDELRNQAVIVVGKGKGSFIGGTRIPPISEGTKVIVQRPGKMEVWK